MDEMSAWSPEEDSAMRAAQAQDEINELAQVTLCFANIEAIISAVEQQYGMELIGTRESIDQLKKFCGVK